MKNFLFLFVAMMAISCDNNREVKFRTVDSGESNIETKKSQGPPKSKFMEEWEAIHKKIKIDYMKVPDGICEVIAYLAELTDKQLSEIIDRVALIERTYVIKEKE